VTTPARTHERIDLDDEISALVQAVQEELSDPVAPEIAARRGRVASGWHALATARDILIRLTSSLRGELAHGARFFFEWRYEIMFYVLAAIISVLLGIAVGVLLGQV
jgi:ABC-type microcin C transport system permease subunit YejE